MFGAFTVGFFLWRENKEVIHVNNEPSFGDHVLEGVIHESLECGWRVGKPEEHDHWFKKAFMGNEGGLPLMAIFDMDIVIAPVDVKFSEQFGILELINEVGDEGKRVRASNGMFVQISVVLAGKNASILLFNNEEQECLGGV